MKANLRRWYSLRRLIASRRVQGYDHLAARVREAHEELKAELDLALREQEETFAALVEGIRGAAQEAGAGPADRKGRA